MRKNIHVTPEDIKSLEEIHHDPFSYAKGESDSGIYREGLRLLKKHKKVFTLEGPTDLQTLCPAHNQRLLICECDKKGLVKIL